MVDIGQFHAGVDLVEVPQNRLQTPCLQMHLPWLYYCHCCCAVPAWTVCAHLMLWAGLPSFYQSVQFHRRNQILRVLDDKVGRNVGAIILDTELCAHLPQSGCHQVWRPYAWTCSALGIHLVLFVYSKPPLWFPYTNRGLLGLCCLGLRQFAVDLTSWQSQGKHFHETFHEGFESRSSLRLQMILLWLRWSNFLNENEFWQTTKSLRVAISGSEDLNISNWSRSGLYKYFVAQPEVICYTPWNHGEKETNPIRRKRLAVSHNLRE